MEKIFNSPLPPFDPFQKIGKEWALLAASHDGKTNAMTVSWGECGVLWNKNVVSVFVRPQRYTKALIDKSGIITLSFFDESFRSTLTYFGRNSGRDTDKFADTGLKKELDSDGAVILPEASLSLKCRVIYTSEIRPENFHDSSLMKNYEALDFHTVYTCEIIGVYQK